MRAIGYVRVSTDKQENSADAQEKKIRATAMLREFQLIDVITDIDEFSGNLNRPGAQQVLEMVNRKQVDVVIITKLDRLSRSTRDVIDLIELFEKKDVAFVSIGEELNTKSPIGRFIVRTIASIAELEREMIGTRTSEGLQNLKSQGFPAGPAPFGFQSQPRTAEEKNLKIRKPLIENPKEQEIIARIVEMRREGRIFEEIATALNKEGHRTRLKGKWNIAGVQRIFVNQEKP